MPLNENILANEFKRILTSNPGGDGQTGIEYFSNQMAKAVIEHIKNYADVRITVDPGIVVSTSSGAGSTTSIGSGKGIIL